MLVRSKDQTQLLTGVRVTPNSSTSSFPLAQFWALGFWLLYPDASLRLFFPTFWAQRIRLFRKISASICDQCTSPVWGPPLSPCFLSCQVVASWRNWKGGMTWPDLVSWAMKCFLMPFPFLMVAYLHRLVWRWTEGEHLHNGIYWKLLLFIADEISDVQLSCSQVYTADFAHRLTSNTP